MSNRSTYDAQLKSLNQSLVDMGRLVTSAVNSAIDALACKDVKRAADIVKGDESIDREERAIEHVCLTLLLLQQPVARDLRQVSTALKIVTDLERIGDHAADIAEIIPHLAGDGIPVEPDISPMAHQALDMANKAIDAFVRRDMALADQVVEADDAVDSAFDTVKRRLAQIMAGGEAAQDAAIDQLLIAKYLERIGDHAVNIAEWVKFCETGVYRQERIV